MSALLNQYMLNPLLAQQQSAPGQSAQQPQAMDALSGLTPEQLQMYSSMGALDDENASIEGQLAQARALRSRAFTEPRTTVGAATLGGLADIINSIRGSAQEKAALERQGAIRDQQSRGRNGLMEAYVSALRRPQQQPAAGTESPNGLYAATDMGD